MVSRLGEPDDAPPLWLPRNTPLPVKKMNVFYKLGWPQVAQLTSLVFVMQWNLY